MAESIIKQNTVKLVKASARHLHLAPRKMRLVANMVKGMNVMDAIIQLEHTNKKASAMIIKLLKSAVANAKNNFGMDTEKLFIQSITVDMGKAMKRYFPRARGSAFVIRRKMSHVNVILEQKKGSKAAKSRLDLFRKKETAVENPDQKDATNKEQKKEHLKQKTFITEEQRKSSTAQNKRRLFNRKSGE
jgi:large subunit ribosomal protein L22